MLLCAYANGKIGPTGHFQFLLRIGIAALLAAAAAGAHGVRRRRRLLLLLLPPGGAEASERATSGCVGCMAVRFVRLLEEENAGGLWILLLWIYHNCLLVFS